MHHVNPWKSYQQVATQTASPGQLVLMLYDGIVRFLEHALAGFELEDPLEFNRTINNNIIRAQAIINELNYSLDMEKGQDCADNFRRLYEYMDRLLQQSNQHKKPEGIHEVIKRITVLRTAWNEMITKDPAGQPQASAQPMTAAA